MASQRISTQAYSIGIAGLLLVSTLKFGLASLFGSTVSGLLFIPVILITATIGGLRAGLLFTALSLPLIAALPPQSVNEINLVLFALVGGGIAWLGGNARDAQMQANTATALLQRRESYLQTVLDSVSDATIATHANGEIVSFNAAAQRLFGYSEGELLNQNVSLLLPEADWVGSPHQGPGYEDGRPTPPEAAPRLVLGRRKDGSAFSMTLDVVEAVSGKEVIYTGFGQDVTESERATAQLEEARSELMRLSRLNEMGEMASALAHEINQPLAAVANYVNGSRRMIERFDPAMLPQLNETLSYASAQALRAGEIIHHLREFMSRGETGKSIVPLNDVIQSGLALAFIGTKEEGIEIRIEPANEAIFVLVDTVQIQQVLVNLLRNAVDSVRNQPEREIVVVTHLEGDEVRVDVSDTGVGISAEMESTIFMPFVTSKTHGMGIGLAISKRIIESHGGTIFASRRRTGGTILSFTLPLVSREALAE